MAPAQSGDHGGPHTSVPYALVPFLAIIGAGAALCICWAFHKIWSEPPPEDPFMTEYQTNYMREVRQRNRRDIAELFGIAKNYRFSEYTQ